MFYNSSNDRAGRLACLVWYLAFTKFRNRCLFVCIPRKNPMTTAARLLVSLSRVWARKTATSQCSRQYVKAFPPSRDALRAARRLPQHGARSCTVYSARLCKENGPSVFDPSVNPLFSYGHVSHRVRSASEVDFPFSDPPSYPAESIPTEGSANGASGRFAVATYRRQGMRQGGLAGSKGTCRATAGIN
jgi:hypothetical protein